MTSRCQCAGIYSTKILFATKQLSKNFNTLQIMVTSTEQISLQSVFFLSISLAPSRPFRSFNAIVPANKNYQTGTRQRLVNSFSRPLVLLALRIRCALFFGMSFAKQFQSADHFTISKSCLIKCFFIPRDHILSPSRSYLHIPRRYFQYRVLRKSLVMNYLKASSNCHTST